MKHLTSVLLALAVCLFPLAADAAPLSTGFTYQGRLTDNGVPANGTYDMRFTLHSASAGANNQVGGTIQIASVIVTNGLFKELLDFGSSPFDGEDRWLEISVRPGGSTNALTVLDPRQSLAPTPYALYAPAAGSAAAATTIVAGGVVNSSLASNSVTSEKIADATIDTTDLNGTLSSNTFWRLTGNSGTTPGTHFIGTTDNEPLELRVDGERALRIEPGGSDSVNVIAGWAGNGVAAGVAGATVAGGGAGNYNGVAYTNRVEANFGTVSGGLGNTIQPDADFAMIGGGSENTIRNTAFSATIGGGTGNTIQTNAYSATIGGGLSNTIRPNADYATIGGGAGNTIQVDADYATIGGGSDNTIQTNTSTATIGGGFGNTIQPNADYATIGGGRGNTIQTNAAYATIPGGYLNSATNSAFAAGYRAKANDWGAFVWADSSDFDFRSATTNEFAVRATGGVRFVSGVGNNGVPVAGVALPSGSGSWTSLSDRNAKTDFTPANPRDVLERLAEIPIQSWRYKTEADPIRHVGPVAQDFHTAFGLGADDTHIATVDADGVALAAIQGLLQLVNEQENRNPCAEDEGRRGGQAEPPLRRTGDPHSTTQHSMSRSQLKAIVASMEPRRPSIG